MGRCLSPCLGDLDPNLYRRRLDEALRLFVDPGGSGRERLLAHVHQQMRRAAAEQRYERAGALRRRAHRLGLILERLGGVLEATHVRPRLILGRHPTGQGRDAFWLVAGRLADWGPLPDRPDVLHDRTRRALIRGLRSGEIATHLPREEIDEVRIIAAYLDSHPDTPQLLLDPAPAADELAAFVGESAERELEHVGADAAVAYAQA